MRIWLFILLVGVMDAQTYWDYRAHLIVEEGYRSSIYQDTRGNPSIGIGHKVLNTERFDTPISRAEIDRLFMADLSRAMCGARAAIPSFDIQPKEVKIVLVSMAFNMGNAGLMKFVKFRAAIEEMDYARAAHELRNSLYYRQLPKRVGRHIETLKKEAN